MPSPLSLAFLGCGFITRVHSAHLRALGGVARLSYASRDAGQGRGLLPASSAASGPTAATPPPSPTPSVDAVVVAVPPASTSR